MYMSYLALNTEYGAKRNSISSLNSVFATNFSCLHRNSFCASPRWSSCKTNKIWSQHQKYNDKRSSWKQSSWRSYQNTPQNTGLCFVATMDKFHRPLYMQWCRQETRNAITFVELEEILALIAESTTAPCAVVSWPGRKRILQFEVNPLKAFS